jgi:hypothetical protein
MYVARNSDRTASIVAGVLLGFALGGDLRAFGGEERSMSAAETDLGRRTYFTENFEITARGSAADLEAWGRRCEALRAELRAKWFASPQGDVVWSPRCVVLLHDDATSYLQAVPGGERTVGSSLVEFGRHRVALRRIDVRGDRDDWQTAALPHELMHVLLADRAIRAPLPRWAEEGLALLVDAPSKQAAHDVDFRTALNRRNEFRVVELVTLDGYPSAGRVAVFYGQSASLVRFLAAQGTPTQFVDFVEQTSRLGHDAALRKIYRIDGIAALETAWLRSLNDNGLNGNTLAAN